MNQHIEEIIIGESRQIKKLKKLICRYAQYPAPVLITGETGTGKELVARSLHYGGVFNDKAFIAVNCSTFSDELFVSELFGYKKGAFTDAKKDHEGLLSVAEGGTVFLDEIDSLSLKSQAALLRFLQEGEFRPIGSSVNHKVNVRIIAATNRNLTSLINTGEFREDLYYRLCILAVHMPALRERTDDIERLAEYFIEKLNRQYGMDKTHLDVALLEKLKQYVWSGNVRELENMLHRLYITSDDHVISDIQDLQVDCSVKQLQPVSVSDMERSDLIVCSKNYDFRQAKMKMIEKFEKNYVLQMLEQTKGNVTKAANLCGKERRAFGKLIKKYNIHRNTMLEI